MIVAFDIETTGLTSNDVVTTAAFDDGGTIVVHVNTNSDGELDTPFETNIGGANRKADIVRHDDEAELLQGLNDTVDTFDLGTEAKMMAGFSAETYKGGFDLPFLRTRCIANGIAWPFQGVNYTDAKDTLESFNTTKVKLSGFNKKPLKKFASAIGVNLEGGEYKSEIVDAIEEFGYTVEQIESFAQKKGWDTPTDSVGTLDDVHDLFMESLASDDEATTLGLDVIENEDPLDDSVEAIQEWKEGSINNVIRHNTLDVRKTLNLVKLAQEYVPEGDIYVKRL